MIMNYNLVNYSLDVPTYNLMKKFHRNFFRYFVVSLLDYEKMNAPFILKI